MNPFHLIFFMFLVRRIGIMAMLSILRIHVVRLTLNKALSSGHTSLLLTFSCNAALTHQMSETLLAYAILNWPTTRLAVSSLRLGRHQLSISGHSMCSEAWAHSSRDETVDCQLRGWRVGRS